MSEKRRFVLLLAIMVTVATVVAAAATGFLYHSVLAEKSIDLLRTASSQARLIEAMIKHERVENPNVAWEHTLGLVKGALQSAPGTHRSGELSIARRSGDSIDIVLTRHQRELTVAAGGDRHDAVGAPMKLALAGHAGVGLARDHQGSEILAAHVPVDALDLGIVLQIDKSEVTGPFLATALKISLVAVLLVSLASAMFFYVGNPILVRLRSGDSKFRGIFANAQVGLGRARIIDGHLLEANERMAEIFGYEDRQTLLSEFKGLNDLMARGKCRDIITEGSETHVVRDCEAEYRRQDGQSIWIRFSAVYHLDDGTFEPVIVDISDHKQAEEALLQSRRQVEMGERTKREFLANMTHELRTPLNAIIGFADMIRGEAFGKLDNPRYEEYVREISQSGGHLLSLINEILQMAQIESDQARLANDEVDVTAAVEEATRFLADKAIAAGLQLVSEIEVGVGTVPADEQALKQILLNLISNAIKFTPSGGRVVVEAALDAGGATVLSIRDNGIGIGADDLSKALNPFQQIDGDLNRQYEGTGLGLPLAKSLVELMGATLEIESTIGVGTTVSVSFAGPHAGTAEAA